MKIHSGIKQILFVLILLSSFIVVQALPYNIDTTSSDVLIFQHYDNETNTNPTPLWSIASGSLIIDNAVYNGSTGYGSTTSKTNGNNQFNISKTNYDVAYTGNLTYEFDILMNTISTTNGQTMTLYVGGSSAVYVVIYFGHGAVCANGWGAYASSGGQCLGSIVYFSQWQHVKFTTDTSAKTAQIIITNTSTGVSNSYVQITKYDTTFAADRKFLYFTSTTVIGYTIDNFAICKGNFCPTAASDSIYPKIQFKSQYPEDLNFSNAVNNRVTISYNISDANLNDTSVKLYYKANNTNNNTMYYLNGTAYSGYFTAETRTNVTSVYNWTMLDNEVHPGNYNTGPVSIDNKVHTGTTTSNSQYYLKTEYLNISNTLNWGVWEIMANATTGLSPSFLYYCNSSYTSGRIDTSEFCSLLQTKTAPASYSHCHLNQSCHIAYSFAINTTSKTIGNIGLTSTSYFIWGGSKDWNYYTIAEETRTGMTQTTTNKGSSWTTQAAITSDQHLHQFNSNVNTIFWYYACANDTYGNYNCSEIRNDTMELSILGPTATTVLSPANQTYNNNILINYTSVFSPSNITIGYYAIDLLNQYFNLNSTITANNSLNLTYAFNTLSVQDGLYIVRVKAVDVLGKFSYGYSEIFRIDNTIPSVTINPTNGVSQSINYNMLFNISTYDAGFIYLLNSNLTTANGTIISNLANYTDTGDNLSQTITILAYRNMTVLGTYNISYYACDGHTGDAIAFDELVKYPIIDTEDNSMDFGSVKIIPQSNILSSTAIKEFDRYSFAFTTDKMIETEILIQSKSKITYFPKSKYKGHFIVENNWIDFEEFPKIQIKKIDDYNYMITTTPETKVLQANSIGALNCIAGNTYFTLFDFSLISSNVSCSVNNCIFNFVFNTINDMNLSIDGNTYQSLNNTNHYFNISLGENTAYPYSYIAKDMFTNMLTGNGNAITSSYAKLLYEEQQANKQFYMVILILAILFILYIISEVFKISMLGTLAGIGIIIYSFTLFTYGTWFVIVMAFAGLVMLARSIFA